ncbi:MAG: hypothetical protein K9G41_08300 [Flavobacteriales bacterium]|nr:hypothetical protein [Flavobacteriales bacterium]
MEDMCQFSGLPYLRYPCSMPFSEQLNMIENALAQHPEDELRLLRLLVSYSVSVPQRHDSTLEWAHRILQLTNNPEYKIDALLARATVLWQDRRNVEEAENIFIKVHALDPDYQQPYENLVDIYLQQKEFNKALHWAQLMSVQEDMEHIGFRLKGEVLQKMERLEEAKAAYQEVIQMDLYPTKSYEGLARCYLAEENWALAKDALVQASERCHYPEVVYPYGVGLCYQNMDDPYRAMKWYIKALDIDPSYPNALNNMAVLQVQLENGWEEAVPYLLKAVELSGEAINDSMRIIYRNLWAHYKRTLNHEKAEYYHRLNYKCLGFDDDNIDFLDAFGDEE